MTLLRLATLTVLVLSALCADPLDYLSIVPSWAMNNKCGAYADQCDTTTPCCPKLACSKGRCLQADCRPIAGQSCGNKYGDCCWHSGLTCFNSGRYSVCNRKS